MTEELNGKAQKLKLEAVVIDNDIYLTPDELAARWKTTVAYLRNRRSDNKGLSYHKFYGRVMYSLEDVLRYEEENYTRVNGNG